MLKVRPTRLLAVLFGGIAALPRPVEAQSSDVERLEAERTRLETQQAATEAKNALQQAEVDASLKELMARNRRLEIEAEIVERQRTVDIAKLQAKKELLELQHEIEELESKRAAAAVAAEKHRLELEAERRQHQDELSLAELELEAKKLELQNNALQEQFRTEQIKLEKQQALYDLEATRYATELAGLELQRERAQDALNRLQTQLETKESQDQWERRVPGGMTYTVKPFKDGVLRVSDRRIALNGPIIEGTADFVTRRIHFFNNKSSVQPIFIMIDRCPGGSVMEGYRILKAMEASDAPIHVVVKSFAASMAAVILTLAESSYAYPNAIILHHQPNSRMSGNITQQEEELRVFREWAKRLHAPVAKRMNVGLEKFYTLMYENNSRGDWEEFADEAKRLGWVDHIVREVREEGVETMPEDAAPEPFFFFFAQNDEDEPEKRAQPKARFLPRPAPFDFYFMYNRSERYQWR
ncbi:MAG: ATP-dependent Clp protease proteolytic subunit [Myxococcota bacterium]